MSRRERGTRQVSARQAAGQRTPPPPPGLVDRPAREPSLLERLEATTLAERALLPIRFFFGITFLYAGLDKLLDPAFLNASDPASIVAQMQAFTHVSPLAPLVEIALPFAVPLGILIAVAEIAIGIGALTGLAFRLAAVGGALLSLTFWLTASWSTHPYYYGPDLPYAVGWLALAIGGTVDVLVPGRIRQLGEEAARPPYGRAYAPFGRTPAPLVEPMPGRRTLLQAGVLAALSLALAAIAAPVGLATAGSRQGSGTADGLGDGSGGGSAGVDPNAPLPQGGATGPQPTEPPGPEETPEDPTDDPTAAPAKLTGLTVATVASVNQKGAVRIRVPANAPSSLPAGDPGVVVRLKDGSYAAFDATCTHQGCRVGWDAQDEILLCPCHGAAFDPNDHGAVLGGPTNTPLLELPIVIDKATGAITLKA
jgi:thiosulfate dehydrogenase [quinone] large subunit